ncbi:peptidoglycan-binding protein [Erwinia papayae]|uniref:Peptidoglycan-binding protein n=1 Tax=Erwinia papayae TaxID=206499 RepID=A0ABV3N7A3_9GAMM
MKGHTMAQGAIYPGRLSSSVGACGSNAPADVKKLQQMISDAGYPLSTGRRLIVDGRCGQGTIEAIRWYQRLLTLSPTGLVMPVDTFFMQAVSRALSPHWRPRNTIGPLHVHEGQITFDAEGVDYLTAVAPFRQSHYPFFSRVLHSPPMGNSGVTLGRGYDMGRRSRGEIHATLMQAGIEEYKAVICSKAAHLKSRPAREFVQVYGPLVGEISHQQQVQLFAIAYKAKLAQARSLYGKVARSVPGAPSWHALDRKVRDVVVDIFYQGVHSAPDLIRAAINGKKALAFFIRNDMNLMRYEQQRKRLRYLK